MTTTDEGTVPAGGPVDVPVDVPEQMDVIGHWQLPNGSILKAEAGCESALPPIPEGARRLTQAEYEQLLAELDAIRATAVGELLDADAQRRQGDYDALIRVGVPHESAHRMSGHVPGMEVGARMEP